MMKGRKYMPIDDEFKLGDTVWVKFSVRIAEVKNGMVYGFTEDNKVVSAPIDAVVEKFPRLVPNGK